MKNETEVCINAIKKRLKYLLVISIALILFIPVLQAQSELNYEKYSVNDGFAKLKNSKDEMIGYRQTRNLFEEVAEKNPEDIIHHLKEKGNAWREGRENEDDITFIVVKVK